ncbi:MAG: DUF2207 domain-containing protein [Candidatus Nanopelagicales bacterium]|nr:DUF2207 domain-containing protein [Candidatus Nanopelagicales bacterium]
MAIRTLSTLALTIAALGLATPAFASESIPSYQVEATVQPDAVVAFTETITYDFSDTQDRHGIFRDIVIANDDSLGRTRQYEVDITGVTIDGQPASYTTDAGRSMVQVKIGDADTTVTGMHTYVITYTMANALRVVTAADVADPAAPSGIQAGDVELYWNLIQNTFGVPITDARATVDGPAAALAARCLVGAYESSSTCAIDASGTTVTLGPTSLADGEYLTTSIVYPAAAFTVTPAEVFAPVPPIGLAIVVGGVLFLGLLIVPMALAIAWRRGDKGVAVQGIPVQFEPPDRLTAAEMAATWKGKAPAMRPRALIAALTDLAARGHVVISDVDRISVTKVDGATSPLAPWETQLLDELFAAQSTVSLHAYDASLTTTWNHIYDGMVETGEASGRRNADGGAPDRRWNWMLIITVLGFAGIVLAFVTQYEPTMIIAFAVTIGSVLGWLIARIITPRRETAESARFLTAVLGFRKLLATDASEARRELAQRLGLPANAILATMLPYAVVYDLEESWVGAFPDLTPEEMRATGFNVVSIIALNSMMGSAAASATSAMTAPGSGSGSGGFSGGGGGGGGGGAW